MRHRPVQNLAVGESDRLEQRAAESLHDGAFDLIVQAVGIDDRAALEHRNHARHAKPPGAGATSAAVAT